MGKSLISGPFSIAMFDYRRVLNDINQGTHAANWIADTLTNWLIHPVSSYPTHNQKKQDKLKQNTLS